MPMCFKLSLHKKPLELFSFANLASYFYRLTSGMSEEEKKEYMRLMTGFAAI